MGFHEMNDRVGSSLHLTPDHKQVVAVATVFHQQVPRA